MLKSIAIIGAGLCGITLARQLQSVAEVTVFEKSPDFGGRMATRHFASYEFDHGAQFFTARSKQFQKLLTTCIDNNVVSLWEPKVVSLDAGQKRFKRAWFEPHYIPVPGMNALGKSLAQDLDVRLQCEVLGLQGTSDGWHLTGPKGEVFGPYNWVVSAVPATQAVPLLGDCFSPMQHLNGVSFLPCFSLMLGFESSLPLNFAAALVKNSPIAWIAVNSSKIDRAPGFAMVVHSDNRWARSHLDLDSEQVKQKLLVSLRDLLGESLPQPQHLALQRWRYAKTESPAGSDYLLDTDNQLAACGDWCRGDRVEDAFLSGLRLGERLQKLL